MNRLWILIIMLVFSFRLPAQDIHFSQFNKSYLNLNPALTGSFDGTYRFNGNFKNQWSSISEPFRTFSAGIEGKSLIKALPQLHLGLLLYNDEAGVGGLRSTQVNLSMAYTHALNYDSTLIIKGGLQLGYSMRSINFDQFTFDRQYNGSRFNSQLANGEDFDRNSYGSVNLHSGFALEYNLESRKRLFASVALFNLTTPNQSFENISVPLDQRISSRIGADYIISDEMDLLPSFLYSRQGTFQEIVIGTDLRYRLNYRRSLASNVYGGVWYRNQDALILSTGLDYQEWNIGISYDINISDLETASNNRGGLELSVTYIIKTFKPNIRRYKVCPNFM